MGGGSSRSIHLRAEGATADHPSQKLAETGRTSAISSRLAEPARAQAGPVLFQLPPFLRKMRRFCEVFLESIAARKADRIRVRHASWFDEEVRDILRRRNVALCVADTDESPADAELTPTADWGYLRLRRADYPDDALSGWRGRVTAQPWERAYVFFKHEDEGKGPAFAKRFLQG